MGEKKGKERGIISDSQVRMQEGKKSIRRGKRRRKRRRKRKRKRRRRSRLRIVLTQLGDIWGSPASGLLPPASRPKLHSLILLLLHNKSLSYHQLITEPHIQLGKLTRQATPF